MRSRHCNGGVPPYTPLAFAGKADGASIPEPGDLHKIFSDPAVNRAQKVQEQQIRAAVIDRSFLLRKKYRLRYFFDNKEKLGCCQNSHFHRKMATNRYRKPDFGL